MSSLLAYGYGPGQARVEIVEVDAPIRNLDAGFDGLRIAQISDIHLGGYMDDE